MSEANINIRNNISNMRENLIQDSSPNCDSTTIFNQSQHNNSNRSIQKIATINTNGISESLKALSIWNYANQENLDIICIQEMNLYSTNTKNFFFHTHTTSSLNHFKLQTSPNYQVLHFIFPLDLNPKVTESQYSLNNAGSNMYFNNII